MNLEEENKKLKRELQAAKSWMSREVWESQKEVTLQKSQTQKNTLYHENLEEIIGERIYSFFPPEVLTKFPSDAVENILSSELIYYHIVQGWHVDGTWVMIGYQKVLDSMVELYITKGFRKYILKHKLSHSPKNDIIDKAFHSVIEKKHTLSLGRFYGVLKEIKKWRALSGYQKYFETYLKSRTFLQKALLETNFLLQLEVLTRLHVLWEKRHSGSLSRKDTQTARCALIWNFEDKNCLLYILAASQSVHL